MNLAVKAMSDQDVSVGGTEHRPQCLTSCLLYNPQFCQQVYFDAYLAKKKKSIFKSHSLLHDLYFVHVKSLPSFGDT